MENTTKQEIISKLFSSKWNYLWGKVDGHLISLFYKKGGFNGLYDFIVSEKERISKDKNFGFNNYYSSDLIETLEKAKNELKDEDFEDYIFSSYSVTFNKTNFVALKGLGMLNYFEDFKGDFKGNIQCIHKIGDYAIIETLKKKNEKSFYNVGDFTNCFEKLEEALLYSIYKGRFFSTLVTLLNSENK